MMTATAPISPQAVLAAGHVVLEKVDWGFYQQLVKLTRDSPVRMSYHKGSLEIVPPQQPHESWKTHIARLIEMMTFELTIPLEYYGSSTFTSEEADAGLEPDECYYIQNAERVAGMEQFDPSVHPAPDLAVEVDNTNRSVKREPIYAALGVPELWRWERTRQLTVLVLDSTGRYQSSPMSLAFPFLPMPDFERFVHRLHRERKQQVLEEFQRWVHTLR